MIFPNSKALLSNPNMLTNQPLKNRIINIQTPPTRSITNIGNSIQMSVISPKEQQVYNIIHKVSEDGKDCKKTGQKKEDDKITKQKNKSEQVEFMNILQNKQYEGSKKSSFKINNNKVVNRNDNFEMISKKSQYISQSIERKQIYKKIRSLKKKPSILRYTNFNDQQLEQEFSFEKEQKTLQEQEEQQEQLSQIFLQQSAENKNKNKNKKSRRQKNKLKLSRSSGIIRNVEKNQNFYQQTQNKIFQRNTCKMFNLDYRIDSKTKIHTLNNILKSIKLCTFNQIQETINLNKYHKQIQRSYKVMRINSKEEQSEKSKGKTFSKSRSRSKSREILKDKSKSKIRTQSQNSQRQIPSKKKFNNKTPEARLSRFSVSKVSPEQIQMFKKLYSQRQKEKQNCKVPLKEKTKKKKQRTSNRKMSKFQQQVDKSISHRPSTKFRLIAPTYHQISKTFKWQRWRQNNNNQHIKQAIQKAQTNTAKKNFCQQIKLQFRQQLMRKQRELYQLRILQRNIEKFKRNQYLIKKIKQEHQRKIQVAMKQLQNMCDETFLKQIHA